MLLHFGSSLSSLKLHLYPHPHLIPMAAKTITDFFNPNPAPAKRRKLSTSSDHQPFSSLTADQKSRIELNKCLAISKRNLKLCSQKVEGSGYVKLEELLVEDTWLQVLLGEFQKPYALNLCKFVEAELSSGAVPIFPPQHLIFNALNSTPFHRVKVVIIGQDPYHGPGQAMGLSFSVPEGVKIPSSLANIFKELKQDLGCSIPSHGNLHKWAVQGVLLLNTVLTGSSKLILMQRKGGSNLLMLLLRLSHKRRKVLFFFYGGTLLKKNPN
ncbi:hypothetical protein ES332_A12G176800v1 [Gossypium tomentosum]|uniref:Uracil-DNA glycosylase-like domain-containing protein n=1 Tax=Gossypium tomentosum TaxID=34277 RepID=A0A5D2MZ68_GOSTO|nr:hypothetical protein ES332_A12G176800v1 [Gossypium tomentosum]